MNLLKPHLVLAKINNISKVLVISGLTIAAVNGFTIDNDWLDIMGISAIMIGIVFSKKDFIEYGGDFGIYQYYTLLGLFVLLVFLFWFK